MYSYASPTLNVMINAARKAGRYLVRDFNEISNVKVTQKSAKSFVTSADLRSEKMIIDDLKNYRVDYSILSEEKDFIQGESSNFTWIIDPLDGTMNFLQGIPFFCISIALRKKNEITHGVIYDPMMDTIFYAEKGVGAYMNNLRLRIPSKPLIDGGFLYVDHAYYNENYELLKDKAHYIRYFGSAALALAYVAAGKINVYLDQGMNIWDRAAGLLMVKESGGYADDLAKKENALLAKNLLAGNFTAFEDFQKTLSRSQSVHG